MRTLSQIILGMAVCLPTLAFSASADPVPGERALREECSAFSEAGMWDCLAKKSRSSEKALQQAQEEAARTLSRWDEDNQYIAQAKSALRAANKVFANYRDAQCAFAASLGGGAIGAALDMGRLACVSELNNRRAAQLRDLVSDLPLK